MSDREFDVRVVCLFGHMSVGPKFGDSRTKLPLDTTVPSIGGLGVGELVEGEWI